MEKCNSKIYGWLKMIDIIAGSKSDEEIVKKVVNILEENNVSFKVSYLSAHRDPIKLDVKINNSKADVFICIAGLSAALPGVVASITTKPVIGVPVSVALGGLDALLSIVQMPKGVPVATVGIDNGENAAYLALRILGVKK
jgi:5-(carboxyamino)imidazole ribonucleotide mutase